MRFITDPGLLKLICSRCESYDCSVQSKSRYFAFVSYAASSNEITVKNQSQNYPNNEIFRRLKKHYETRWFQRKLREPIRTRSEPHGKETNVTVALAIQAAHSALEAKKNGEKARFVIVSGDSNYEPLIEYILNLCGVVVEVWAREASLSEDYAANLKKWNVKVFNLDFYRFQIGFLRADLLLFPFDVEFHSTPETIDFYNSVSHYTIVQGLLNSLRDVQGNNVHRFDTKDFKIQWYPITNSFVIWFFKVDIRVKFMNWLKNNMADSLANVLNQLQHESLDYRKLFEKRGQTFVEAEEVEQGKLEKAAQQIDKDNEED